MVVALEQAPERWLVIRARPAWPPPGWRGPRSGLGLIVGVIAIIVAAVWVSHRLMRPFARFAEAADRLGVDMRAPPLIERGSRELRKAIHAFNRMQERIRRLVEDRTRMLAAISHDLRTALTRLRLRVDDIGDPEQRAKALADLAEMETMLSATLSFARDDNADEPRSISPASFKACATISPTPARRSAFPVPRASSARAGRWPCAGRWPI